MGTDLHTELRTGMRATGSYVGLGRGRASLPSITIPKYPKYGAEMAILSESIHLSLAMCKLSEIIPLLSHPRSEYGRLLYLPPN